MVAVTVAWLVAIPLAVLALLLILAFARRDDPPPARPVAEYSAESDTGRVVNLPPQSSDYLVTLVEYEVTPVVALIAFPVIVAWTAWIVARRRDSDTPT